MPRRCHRVLVTSLALLLVAAIGAAALLVTPEQADARARGSSAQKQHQLQRAKTSRSLERARRQAPLAVAGVCPRTMHVPGQGESCRTADGLYLVPRRDGTIIETHGPDVVETSTPGSSAGGFGTTDAIVCSAASSTRHVQLTYLIPSDHSSGAPTVRGDRFAEVTPLLQQALLDGATVIDRRAGELAHGTRRRLRVLCDDTGMPTVERIVLPRSAASYASTVGGGFTQLEEDLRASGTLPDYPGYRDRRSPSLRRTLAYYDADFLPGIAGQGTMFERSSMLDSAARNGSDLKASHPLVSRTTRNINNNPPTGSLAVQYGTSDGRGVAEPRFGDLLHELSHTMGAVQSELPTSSGNGHCIDGLDVMCYNDGGPAGSRYSPLVCPDTVAPFLAEDEMYDCGGDTYFHPAPAAGNPLASTTVWHLGLVANETLSTSTGNSARPKRVGRIRIGGTGTRRVVRWPAMAPTRGRQYEVGYRIKGTSDWSYMASRSTTAIPPLRPFRAYEISVAAIDRRGQIGPRRFVRGLRTRADNTPPERPIGLGLVERGYTQATIRFTLSDDNVRTTAYVIERRDGARWVQQRRLKAPRGASYPPGSSVTTSVSGLRSGTATQLRLRALDARGNRSTPSLSIVVRTRR